jgi:glycerophosphoryl diester phosphodiesterase
MSASPLRVKEKSLNAVLNIAHRGARAFAPENTLAAFEKAKLFGCPMFEIDVHTTKDGALIVHHDDQLSRCTDVKIKFPGRNSYYISDFTCAELSNLDAGSWYVKQLSLAAAQRQLFLQTLTDDEIAQFISREDIELYTSGTIRLPTLKQTLELARRLDLMVNIELKTLPRMYPGMADAVVNLVETLAMEHRVLISSFDHQQVQQVRQRSEIIATGVLTSDRMVNPEVYLKMLDADAYNPGLDSLGFNSVQRKLDAVGIQNVLDLGYGVNVWTCNDKIEMRQLISAGVTGLMSDYPNRVQEILEEHQTQNVY